MDIHSFKIHSIYAFFLVVVVRSIQCDWFVVLCLLCCESETIETLLFWMFPSSKCYKINHKYISDIFIYPLYTHKIVHHLYTRSRALYNRFISIWHEYGHNWCNEQKEITKQFHITNRNEWNCYKTIIKLIVDSRFCFFCRSNFLTFADSWRMPSFL